MATATVGPPKVLPLDFDGWDKPAQGPPATLPPDFNGWDTPATTPPPVHASVPVPAGLQGPPPQRTFGDVLTDVAKGALKGVGNTDLGIGRMVHAIPGVGETLAPQAALDQLERQTTANNTAQKVGKGIEQAGEFLLPMGAEAKAGELAGAMLPKAAQYASPVARILASAAGAGAVNKAHGGSFGGGALAGAVGGTAGEAAKAVAPMLAESALGVRNVDRAFGRTPGKAILEDTQGILPKTVARSAQDQANALTQQLEAKVNQASAAMRMPKPPIRGALPAPRIDVPLGEPPVPGKMPGALLDAEPFPAQNVGEARILRNRQGQILPMAERKIEFPGEDGLLPPGRNYQGQFLTRQPSRKAFMSGTEGALEDAPPLSGPGVLRTNDPAFWPAPKPGESYPLIPDQLSPNAPTLRPARDVVSNAMGRAAQENSPQLYNPLQALKDQLSRRFLTGEAIPEQVTPREVLDLKRGVGTLEGSWPIDTRKATGGTIRDVYHALDAELDRTVPEAAGLNQRISSLIPVAKRAEATDLGAGLLQKSMGRLGRPTGALLGSAVGGEEGYRHGGAMGATIGATLGLFAPELLASPEAQMLAARYAPTATRYGSRAATGGLFQLTR